MVQKQTPEDLVKKAAVQMMYLPVRLLENILEIVSVLIVVSFPFFFYINNRIKLTFLSILFLMIIVFFEIVFVTKVIKRIMLRFKQNPISTKGG